MTVWLNAKNEQKKSSQGLESRTYEHVVLIPPYPPETVLGIRISGAAEIMRDLHVLCSYRLWDWLSWVTERIGPHSSS